MKSSLHLFYNEIPDLYTAYLLIKILYINITASDGHLHCDIYVTLRDQLE